MKRAALVLSLLLFPLAALRAAPDEGGIPPVVARGFQALVRDGTFAALDAWLAGSAAETNDQFRDDAANHLALCSSTMGRILGFEPVRTVSLSPSTRRVYVVVKFEKGVGWMSFDCYRPGPEWIICRLLFNTNPNLVLPPGVLTGESTH